ncbi:ATP phosphoribosyltransferase regulatory subunit [Saccharibacillus kuerlensis]|uniref:ATP phosphoribosyltransferase regulatory subunit n=1 Tax=Saccharibacillus kuerlensis TaxID=459527 RepID=A0ABQ2L6N1_9BACL|nr:ATP phosphoribosyltransferase regulatory subunit [Saccharibacillus kuerlensis]GGO05193.1 ATP phosphoribosyltransferase regulatory subunit [Saccharibacillus kuerlensis]
MSKPKGFEKPVGVRDYLPRATKRLRRIEHSVLDCMSRWGYEPIKTPTIEYYDTVGIASSTSDRKLFKLLNNRGQTLVLRSDMTAPIARAASSLLRDEPLPLRLSYHANVFRAIEEEAGREAEFFQTGVELIGDRSPEADAEVVALAIASLQAAGVKTFKFALGHVGFLNGLFAEALPDRLEDQLALKERLLHRDYVGFREAAEALGLNREQQEELEGILRLRGGREVCQLAAGLSRHPLALESLRHLCSVWEALDDYGVSEHVLIDLTMIGDFSYYTGMVFEGYAAELGFPVCSGGRYDNLLRQFGRDIPATGFALKTNRILDGVEDPESEEELPVLIVYDTNRRAEALAEAGRLRAEGRTAVTRLSAEREESAISTQEAANADGEQGGRYSRVLRFTGENQSVK